MSITVPTTKEVSDNIIAQLETTLNQSIPLFPKAVNRVISQAFALVFMTIYKYAGWVFLQNFVAHAQNEFSLINGKWVNPLQEWGVLSGVGLPSAATQAELTIEVTVTNQVGTIASGTQLLGNNNGVTYLTLTSITLDAATKTVNVKAVADQQGGNGAGVIGNLQIGDELSFATTQSSVNQTAPVTAQVVTGADAQSTESYRQEITNIFKKRPQGGAYVDYRVWSLTVSGIETVYVYTGEPGQVDVYVESATEVDGIPTQPQLDEVAAAIELDDNGLASRRPVGAYVNTLPITRAEFDVIVTGIVNVSDVIQVEADITEAVGQYMMAREPYIVGLSTGVKSNNVTNSGVSSIVDEIVNAEGGTFDFVTLMKGVQVIGTYSLNEGEKAKILTVSFS